MTEQVADFNELLWNELHPLFIPLKSEFYEAFADGSKTVEYRRYGPRWNQRTCQVGRPVVLSKGYGKRHRMRGKITGFMVSNYPTQTEAWKKCYGDSTDFAACITIQLERAESNSNGK